MRLLKPVKRRSLFVLLLFMVKRMKVNQNLLRLFLVMVRLKPQLVLLLLNWVLTLFVLILLRRKTFIVPVLFSLTNRAAGRAGLVLKFMFGRLILKKFLLIKFVSVLVLLKNPFSLVSVINRLREIRKPVVRVIRRGRSNWVKRT